jgi:hypothetical protein
MYLIFGNNSHFSDVINYMRQKRGMTASKKKEQVEKNE